MGTRGSALALAQAAMVEAALHAVVPDLAIEIRIIKTGGDESANEPVDRKAGRKGMFTAEIERALLEREIDLAVHSAKDLPSAQGQQLEIAAVLPRASVEDVLVTKNAGGLGSLRSGALVATGSVRRSYQLNRQRSDLCVIDLRGNVPTRLRKLVENDWDGIVLARAGLERLGFLLANQQIEFEGRELFAEILSPNEFVPAGGQGIIALQIRHSDRSTKEIVSRVNHAETHLCLRAEREFLRLLDGDCDSPVGVNATIADRQMTLRAQIFEQPGESPKEGHIHSSIETPEPEKTAAALYARIYGQS
jgi:hydroxymethylbilane synthase